MTKRLSKAQIKEGVDGLTVSAFLRYLHLYSTQNIRGQIRDELERRYRREAGGYAESNWNSYQVRF